MSWYPELPQLELWRSTYRAVARANGAEPDADRRMRVWARQAGLPQAQISSSVWTYATPEAPRWWGTGQADRYGGEVFAEQALRLGASADDVAAIAEGWRRWAEHRDAWFVIVHGELIARA